MRQVRCASDLQWGHVRNGQDRHVARLGTSGVAPDIQTLGKGLDGGYVPIAALLISHRVSKLCKMEQGRQIVTSHGNAYINSCFVHGQTYQAHPMVCAAALEVHHVIKQEDLITNCKKMGDYLGKALQKAFADNPFVGNIRGRGLFWGVCSRICCPIIKPDGIC